MQQGLESQRVVPELSLVHWYSVRVMEYSVLILELPLEPATPQGPRSIERSYSLNFDVNCRHSLLVSQSHPRRQC